MENDPQQPAVTDSSTSNRWVRFGRKILIGAAFTYCINFILERTGWDSWETFSQQADTFAENMMQGSARLSPFALWKSLSGHQAPDYSTAYYLPENILSDQSSMKGRIVNWLNHYWYRSSGKPFWIGRILLMLSIVAGITLATGDYRNAGNKQGAVLLLPLNVLWKTILVLLVVGIACLLLYLVIKFFLFIGGALAFLVSAVYASGGFIKNLADEIKGEAAESSKKTVAAWLLPFLFRKKSR